MIIAKSVRAREIVTTTESLDAYLRADERDLAVTVLPELPATRTPFMLSNSSLRGLGDRWNMHRSGRFGWHRSWEGKDRFQEIANLAWPATASFLRWNGSHYRVPSYAAYRIVVSEVLQVLLEQGTQSACFRVAFNPLIALVVASRMSQLRIDVITLSSLGFQESRRFVQLQLLPSYVLDFVPCQVTSTTAHRHIRIHESHEIIVPQESLPVYIHDLCGFPVEFEIIQKVLASAPSLVIAPLDMLANAAHARSIFELDGRSFAMAYSN